MLYFSAAFENDPSRQAFLKKIFFCALEYITILAYLKKKKKPVVDLTTPSKPNSRQAGRQAGKASTLQRVQRVTQKEYRGVQGWGAPLCIPPPHRLLQLASLPHSQFMGPFGHPPMTPSRAISS